MSKSQRTKGATYEREVVQRFSDFFGRAFKRNIGQARDGGNDIDIGPLVVECKRRKSLKTLMGWYHQAVDAALPRWGEVAPGDELAIPVVVMRQDADASMVLLSLEDFLEIAEGWLRPRLDA